MEKHRYPNLEAEIARKGFSKNKYGEIIGLNNPNVVSSRLTGKTKFTLPEIKKSLDLFDNESLGLLIGVGFKESVSTIVEAESISLLSPLNITAWLLPLGTSFVLYP